MVVLAFVVPASPSVVRAYGRVALAAGDSTCAHVGRLPNPDSDAPDDMSAALRPEHIERGVQAIRNPLASGERKSTSPPAASGAAMTTDSFTVVANQSDVTAHNRADCPALRHAPNRTQHANFDSLAIALLMSDGRPWPCGHCWPATLKPAGFRRWLANLALAAARALADRERKE